MSARKKNQLSQRTLELAWAAPLVAGTRLGHLWSAWPNPSAWHKQEFYRMGAEKVVAFTQSWQAMAAQTVTAQQQWALWWMKTWCDMAFKGHWMNPLGAGQLAADMGQQLSNAWLDLATKGIAPIHSKAVANARRLGCG